MGNKERLLEHGATLIAELGYHNFTIEMLVAATGIAKSNAYYHYPSKEALGTDVLQYWIRAFSKLDSLTLQNRALSVQEQFRAYQLRITAFQIAMSYPGDPIAALTVGLDTAQSRELFLHHHTAHTAALTAHIKHGMKSGQYSQHLNPGTVAQLIFVTLSGACQQVKILETVDPLTAAFSAIDSLLSLHRVE